MRLSTHPMPLANANPCVPLLERSDVALERLAGGVLPPGVLVPFVLAERVLDVGRGQVDRRHDGARERVGPLTSVNGARAEAGVEVVRKDFGHMPVVMSENGKLTCLIVDDEPQLRRVLARLMEADGFDVRRGRIRIRGPRRARRPARQRSC